MSIKGSSISYFYHKQTAKADYGTDPEYKPVNRTGGQLKENVEKIRSNQIQVGRQRSSLISTKRMSEGTIEAELSANAFTDFISAALQSGSAVTVAMSGITDISSDAGAKTFTTVAADFATNGPKANQLFKITGFADSTIDGVYRAKSVTATVITVYETIAATEAAGATIAIDSKRYTNGESPSYFLLQERIANIATLSFDRFQDCEVDTLSVDMSGGVVTTSISLKGIQKVRATSKNSSTADASGITTEKMVSYSNLKSLVMNNVLTTFDISSLKLSINNGLSPQEVVNSKYPAGFRADDIDVSADIELYLENQDEYTKYDDGTEFNMAFHLVDSSDNAIGVLFDNAEYESMDLTGDGANDDAFYSGKISASKDDTTGNTIHIDIC